METENPLIDEILPTWRMLDEIMENLLKKPKSTDKNSIHRLADFVMSKEFNDSFLYIKQPDMSYETYEDMVDKYQSFTKWLLGRFFFLSSCDNDEIIIEAQLSILNQLSHTLAHVYSHIAGEYMEAFKLFCKYMVEGGNPMVVDRFRIEENSKPSEMLHLQQVSIEVTSRPMCVSLIGKSLKIIGAILLDEVSFYNPNVDLSGMIYLAKSGQFELEIFALLVQLLERARYNYADYSVNVTSQFGQLCALFEQYVYDYYTNPTINPQFEELLLNYLKLQWDNERVVNFIINHHINAPNFGKIQQYCANISSKTLIPLNKVSQIFSNNDTVMFQLIKTAIHDDITRCYESNPHITNLDVAARSETWKLFMASFNWPDCQQGRCQLHDKLTFLHSVFREILDVKLKFHPQSVNFLDGNLLPLLLQKVAQHGETSCPTPYAKLTRLLPKMLVVMDSNNLDIMYHLIARPLLENSAMPCDYIAKTDVNLRGCLLFLYGKLSGNDFVTWEVMHDCNEFFQWLASGLVKDINRTQVDSIELQHVKLLKRKLNDDVQVLCEIVLNIPLILHLFTDKDSVVNNILLPLMDTKVGKIQQKLLETVPVIICTSSCDFSKSITADSVEVCCNKCHTPTDTKVNFAQNRMDLSGVNRQFITLVINSIIGHNPELKMAAIKAMPYLSQHVPKFYIPDVTKIWIDKLAYDGQKDVRQCLASNIQKIITHGHGNPDISPEVKRKNLECLFTHLLKLSKKSLQYSEYDLQDTLWETIDQIGQIPDNYIKLECMKILLYFVMVPTSGHSYIATNRCAKLSCKDSFGLLTLYKHNSEALCEVIVHLSYCNQHIINASLQESLLKVSAILGFARAKDFVTKEAKVLLPFLVVKVAKNPKVHKLMEDMAGMVEVEVSELLTRNYGNVFLYLVLGNLEVKDTKDCLAYLEARTGLSGPKLRKINFRVILNELLLNFHEKRKKVLQTIELLMAEENTNQANTIADYLQPYFLPFLLYFDLELTSQYTSNEKILPSLADLFKFLGPSKIMPLRFKIIAMLQTEHYLKHAELTCDVWDAFVRNVDVECLGPHLATIFVAMLPLMDKCPNNVNRVFQYLMQHERSLKDHIPDLFFINQPLLSSNITNVIKKHLALEGAELKDKIQHMIRYLKHDTLEVRIQALKQLKICLQVNREELDQMILGYNGIDPVVVELIDCLTLGCWEKDTTLKLACGEVFAELGAIEPSHLPRRYAHDSQSFVFFVTEDGFIESALNELVKAFQTDKNARNTDRVALAIQEILKTYEISPDELSQRHFMWIKFSEAQREVMTPLLSSKYICMENSTQYPCPIYGSRDGSTFQGWLYNWTSSLISTLPPEKKTLLQSCFPSMKLDKRVLMHFLPYILLHSLLENSETQDICYKELEAVLKGFGSDRIIDQQTLENRQLPIPGLRPACHRVREEEKQVKCTKVVFILLDFLDRWLREWQWTRGQSAGADKNYQTIKSFLGKFCKLDLAKCNYECGEYPRALIYLEDFIAEDGSRIYSNLQFLAEIYAQLDEPDGVLGVEPLQQSEPNLEQKLLSLEVSGKLNDAAAIYEHMPRPLKLQHIHGLLQCYLGLNKVNTALYCVEGALDLQPEYQHLLFEMQAESLWRLGSYEDLDNLLMNPEVKDNNSWGVQIGHSLVSLRKNDRDEFKRTLELMKKQEVDSFGAASLQEGAYHHGYSCIIRLHCLNELEMLERMLNELFVKPNDGKHAEKLIKKLASEWQLRIKVVQESPMVVEPLLCMRRVSLSLARGVAEKRAPTAVPFLDNLLGDMWLQSIIVARNAGVHQQAFTYVLDAQTYNPPKLFIEKAKLHWLREEHEEALITLKRGLNVYIPEGSSQESQQAIARLDVENKKLCAEARLLIATYNNDNCSVDVETNLTQYRESVEVYKEWEKSVVCLAQYQDRIFQNYSDEEKDTKANELQLHIINNFGKSMYFGSTYIYQSMPRLLSIWFDYGTRLSNVSNVHLKEERRGNLVKMIKLVDAFLNKLPAFAFLTSFSQIISRIAHPQKEVYVQLKSIIVKLVESYPQQCLWMISSVIKSSYPTRAKRCADVLGDPRLKSIFKLIKDFTSLTEKLIELCNKEMPNDINSYNVSLLVRSLPRLLNKGDFSEIMMPTYKFRKLILPNPDFKKTQHNPFPNKYVHIVSIEDHMTILTSLQRPRKISFRGSDGKSYTFMLKPKDDLRKDFRLMEFNDIVNHLLMRDAEARQRRLNIRLYSVAPLNEECGLIEWLDDLVGLRPVLMNLYKQRGLGMRPREIKEVCCNLRDPLVKKREIFNNYFLKMHPPVLGDWFRKTFPDAQTWMTARTSYTRTTAVISITGYMLGLGDRHGENILLDSTCGDVVHVDFNCLFNKGETFEWPERVPFRLTQNMIAAMGPLGVEGVFRKSCEFTLRVLRSNTATLMSIVTPFVYDPLVSWPRNVPAAAQSAEKVNELALEHIKNIELRLQGTVKTRNRAMSQCLSIEGQIDYLIKEAKSVDNLCQMYIGWGPYL